MSTSQFDIIHTDDSDTTRNSAERKAQRLGLTYLGVETLDALGEALKTSRARIYVLDGKFPIKLRRPINFNADKAVALIREEVGDDARILLVSGESEIENIAQQLGIDHINKQNLKRGAGEMVERIQTILENDNQAG